MFRRPLSPATRRGWSSSELVSLVGFSAVVLGLSLLAYARYRGQALTGLCHAQQKSLQRKIDALELPHLDRPLDEIVAELVLAGSLVGRVEDAGGRTLLVGVELTDPGGATGSHRQYVLMPRRRQLGCRTHGSPFLDDRL